MYDIVDNNYSFCNSMTNLEEYILLLNCIK